MLDFKYLPSSLSDKKKSPDGNKSKGNKDNKQIDGKKSKDSSKQKALEQPKSKNSDCYIYNEPHKAWDYLKKDKVNALIDESLEGISVGKTTNETPFYMAPLQLLLNILTVDKPFIA